MVQKIELIRVILQELTVADNTTFEPPPIGSRAEISFPPQLSLGDGRFLPATKNLIGAISEYAGILSDNNPSLKNALKTRELEDLIQRAFAQTLAEIDLDGVADEIYIEVQKKVETRFEEAVARNRRVVELTLGCQLLVGVGVYPIKIGPVVFDEKLKWLEDAHLKGRVSKVAVRRIASKWRGQRLRKRKAFRDSIGEQGILDSVGQYPIVCSVQTNGLSWKMIEEKGVLTARLAMTTLSLMWQNPSKRLDWMKLQCDGPTYNRHHIVIGEGYRIGTSNSKSSLPVGKSVEPSWNESYALYSAEFNQIGEALSTFVNPEIETTRRKLLSALFLSLWWYHQACREPSDQMATTKFAASMDALSGGMKAHGIVKFIGARLGFKPNDALMKNGSTTQNVVATFYNAGRSKLIHGTSADYSHDWSEERATAEVVGRLSLLSACKWMANNPQSDDLKAMSLP